MRRRTSTSDGAFPDGYIQPSRTGFLVYFLRGIHTIVIGPV